MSAVPDEHRTRVGQRGEHLVGLADPPDDVLGRHDAPDHERHRTWFPAHASSVRLVRRTSMLMYVNGDCYLARWPLCNVFY
ncbi:hypothetical protein MPRF_25040 [Mycolicibacterium parafortuitum]|uniref:Uncharacterized protein n=1 Tax=Mycolicibacterium parafortuitum TaxID=39692 RepID=A0A7I7U3J4_MYCPF|nr:hypothetical protein MPRF_25040 [Mycolicibacterium parafortuitum]